MTSLYLRKLNQIFIPADAFSKEIMEDLQNGAEFKAIVSMPRNLPFHKKFFALLNFAYSNWCPEGDAKKDFDEFRKDLLILAGYGYPVFSLSNPDKYVVKAKSISFANMDDIEFAKVYSKMIDVVLNHVLKNYTGEQLEKAVNDVLRFC